MPSTHTRRHDHIVFSTKRRAPIMDAEWREALFDYLGGAVRATGAHPVAIGGIEDHVHLLVGIRPTHRLSDILRDIKRASSIWVRDERLTRGFAWQDGYGGFSVSPSAIDAVTRYVLNQEEHHRNRSFQEEYLTLLKLSGVDYDPRYLWDE